MLTEHSKSLVCTSVARIGNAVYDLESALSIAEMQVAHSGIRPHKRIIRSVSTGMASSDRSCRSQHGYLGTREYHVLSQ